MNLREIQTIVQEIFETDYVYIYNLPKNLQKLNELPVIKIEPIGTNPKLHGSNRVLSVDDHIQIFLFSSMNDLSIENKKVKLIQTLEEKQVLYQGSFPEAHEEIQNVLKDPMRFLYTTNY